MTTTTTHMAAPPLEIQNLNHQPLCQNNALDSADSSNSTTMMVAVEEGADEALASLPCPNPTEDTTAVDTAQAWAADVAQEAMSANCTTIGLISGSRDSTPRSVIEAYARLIANALSDLRSRHPMLIVRLSSHPAPASRRDHQQADSVPSVTASPLGPWSEVTIAVAAGKQARGTLESLSYLLPNWKREFGFILVDLGPIAEVHSRLVGGHCDSCFLVLGPESCGSHEWLLQQIAWHARSGSTICGTLVTELV